MILPTVVYGHGTRQFVLNDKRSAADAVVGDPRLPEILLIGKGEGIELPCGQFHRTADVDLVLTVDVFELVAHQRFVEGGEDGRHVFLAVLVGTAELIVLLALFPSQNGEIVGADDHILRGAHDRLAVGEL